MARWSTSRRTALVFAVAIAFGSVFVATCTLALGNPMPQQIDTAVVGNTSAQPGIVNSVQRVADGSLTLHDYPSRRAALHAIDLQRVYAALDLTRSRCPARGHAERG
jgi:hypothetical protein